MSVLNRIFPKYKVGQVVRIIALNPEWALRQGLETTVLERQWDSKRSTWMYTIDTTDLPLLMNGANNDKSVEKGLRPVKYDGNETTTWDKVTVWNPKTVKSGSWSAPAERPQKTPSL